MDKRYRIIFTELLKDEGYFKGQLLRLGVSEGVSEEIIRKAPVILKKNLSLKDARQFADAFFQAGGRVTIHDESQEDKSGSNGMSSGIVTLKDFTMCPQCGYKQIKTDKCVKCGLLF